MRYFVFFIVLLLTSIYAMEEEEIDFAILLLFLDIFFIIFIC